MTRPINSMKDASRPHARITGGKWSCKPMQEKWETLGTGHDIGWNEKWAARSFCPPNSGLTEIYSRLDVA